MVHADDSRRPEHLKVRLVNHDARVSSKHACLHKVTAPRERWTIVDRGLSTRRSSALPMPCLPWPLQTRMKSGVQPEVLTPN
eukprot:4440781-Prymnesium_polylepis.1